MVWLLLWCVCLCGGVTNVLCAVFASCCVMMYGLLLVFDWNSCVCVCLFVACWLNSCVCFGCEFVCVVVW